MAILGRGAVGDSPCPRRLDPESTTLIDVGRVPRALAGEPGEELARREDVDIEPSLSSTEVLHLPCNYGINSPRYDDLDEGQITWVGKGQGKRYADDMLRVFHQPEKLGDLAGGKPQLGAAKDLAILTKNSPVVNRRKMSDFPFDNQAG